MKPTMQPSPVLPPNDLSRGLTLAQPDSDRNLPHVGVAGGTYTITVPGEATAGRLTVIDMHIPPGGGPPPHRHDFGLFTGYSVARKSLDSSSDLNGKRPCRLLPSGQCTIDRLQSGGSDFRKHVPKA